jgi:hypothetical protein
MTAKPAGVRKRLLPNDELGAGLLLLLLLLLLF